MSASVDPPYQVPATPPDTIPASFDDDAVFVTDGSPSRVSTTILAVHFTFGTTLAEKHEAIDLIAGRVIGGVAVSEEGLYYVQVEGDGTIATIDSHRLRPSSTSNHRERVPGADSVDGAHADCARGASELPAAGVGREPGLGHDGRYYVQVAGDGTIETIFRIAHTLDALPQVALANPYIQFRVGRNHVSRRSLSG